MDTLIDQKFINATRLYLTEKAVAQRPELAESVQEYVNVLNKFELAKICQKHGLEYIIKEDKVIDHRDKE